MDFARIYCLFGAWCDDVKRVGALAKQLKHDDPEGLVVIRREADPNVESESGIVWTSLSEIEDLGIDAHKLRVLVHGGHLHDINSAMCFPQIIIPAGNDDPENGKALFGRGLCDYIPPDSAITIEDLSAVIVSAPNRYMRAVLMNL